jgi:hydroxymethylglutaryl-CoA lyase
MSEAITIREVGLRDGLQMVKTILTVDQKLEWCRSAFAAGIRHIEVTSFVPPTVIPQFADADEVCRGARAMEGLEFSALVPNLKGAERALAAGVPVVNFVLSASEAHNLANVRRTTQQSIDQFKAIVTRRDEIGDGRASVCAGVATSFGCTLAGVVPEKTVLSIVSNLLELGADAITIADTVGYASPKQVSRLMGEVIRLAAGVPVACHFHDTFGLGLANVAAAIDAGVREFDASLGGLGGCPFAPNASGNINTEDCAYLVESLGFDTGLDIDALIALRRMVEDEWLRGERFTGAVARAGLPKTFRRSTAAA